MLGIHQMINEACIESILFFFFKSWSCCDTDVSFCSGYYRHFATYIVVFILTYPFVNVLFVQVDQILTFLRHTNKVSRNWAFHISFEQFSMLFPCGLYMYKHGYHVFHNEISLIKRKSLSALNSFLKLLKNKQTRLKVSILFKTLPRTFQSTFKTFPSLVLFSGRAASSKKCMFKRQVCTPFLLSHSM